MQLPGTWLEDEKGNPYGICSMAELIFLSNGQSVEDRLKGDILINGDVSYNTEEQLTGKRWTDGKPIYQKSVYFGDGSYVNANRPTADLSNLNVDKVWVVNGHANDTVEGSIAIPVYLDGVMYVDFYCARKKVILTFNTEFNGRLSNAWATVQYTKTTDTANSPVKTMQLKPMLNYSTEEQIIGTWIDGKPVYQKTFVGRGENDENSRYIPSIFIDDFKDLVYSFGTLKLDGVSILVSNGVYGSFVYNPTNGIEIYQTVSVSKKSYDYYATYQYTKTTDTTTLYISPDANNYTLDEKVVGHWIDGKPIYQKTWKCDNVTAPSAWDVTNADFANIDVVVNAGVYDADSTTKRFINAHTRKLSTNVIRFYLGDQWASIDCYTLQYTKTTD